MAPLPPDSTPRYFLDYVANGRAHTVQFRYTSLDNAEPGSDILTDWQDILVEVGEFMPTDWAPVGHRWAAAGSNVSNPVTAALPALVGQMGIYPALAPAFLSFVGRGADGRRVRLSFLGCTMSPANLVNNNNDYRLSSAENANVEQIVSMLNETPFTTISGTIPSWKQYANLGFNAYWQQQVRP